MSASRKRIVVISEDLAEPWDEGIKKFAYSIGTALSSENELLMINVDRSNTGDGASTKRLPGSRTFMHPRLRAEVSRFQPDIVFYVPSPSSTVASFVRAFALRRHVPRAAIAMVALIPRRHPKFLKPMLRGTAPDKVFVPSYRSLLHLRDLDLKSGLVSMGVDPALFRHAREGEKESLRQKHGVSQEAYVFLHVGHLSPKRNLDLLGSLAKKPGTEVVLIGSTSTVADISLRARLESAGVRVIREYVPVDEFYRLADCYVFPVVDSEGSVEIPLSVLEALASGIPVISRPFGGLRDVLPPGEDLRFWDSDAQFAAHVEALQANGGSPVIRDMRSFSWENIAQDMLRALESV